MDKNGFWAPSTFLRAEDRQGEDPPPPEAYDNIVGMDEDEKRLFRDSSQGRRMGNPWVYRVKERAPEDGVNLRFECLLC